MVKLIPPQCIAFEMFQGMKVLSPIVLLCMQIIIPLHSANDNNDPCDFIKGQNTNMLG